MGRNPFVDAIVVLLIVVLFFAPKRLPLLGRGIGQGIKEFKHGLSGRSDESQPQLPEAGESTPPSRLPG